MGKFSTISTLTVHFSHPDLHRLCSDTLDLDPFFDSPDRDKLVLDPLQVIRDAITEVLHATTFRTTDTSRIPTLVNMMGLSWSNNKDEMRRLRDPKRLEQAFLEATKQNAEDFVILAHCDGLYFSDDFDGLNMDLVDTSSFPTTRTSTTPNFPYNPITPPSPGTPSHSRADVFNYQSLPTVIQKRYNDYHNQSITVRVQDLTPFTLPDGTHSSFYDDPTIVGQRVILRNGAVLSKTLDFKRLTKEPPTCTGTTPSDLRRWYNELSSHALSSGYYIVPYELLTSGHGEHNGFLFGVDLPDSLRHLYFDWQNDIGRILRKTTIFPTDSDFSKRVATTTNGYHALLALVTDTHPAFVSQPIQLVMNWPRQKTSQNIYEFYNQFNDILKLKAIFLEGAEDMNSPHMIDCFISNCLHSKYLTQISRLDRQDPGKSSQFSPGSLPITLQMYLQNPDSPSHQVSQGTPSPRYTPVTPSPNKYPPRRSGDGTPYTPYPRRVNELQADENIDDYVDAIIAQVGTAPAITPTCIMCGEVHKFENCPLIQDQEFLKTYAIRVTSLVQKLLRQAQRDTGSTKVAHIRQMLDSDLLTPDSLLPPPEESDFQKGKD